MDNFVKTLIEEVKSQGVFDEFRFNCCLADVDTKPAYQNVRNRVETAVNDFLGKQHWTPDTNKVQLRERLRKHLLDSDVLDKGVDHIVDQVVNPKVATIFEPKIESIAYKYLGITPPPPPTNPPPRPPLLPAPPLPPYPGHTLGHMNGGNMLKVETTASLLPTDLEQISPDSDRATFKSDMKDDSKDDELPPGVDEDDMDYDDATSPAFEPTASIKEEINNGSLNTSDSIKDVKELANDSRDAGASQTSQLSQVSSDSRLTIASTDAPQPTSANNSVELASNIAANISEEAQMPKFNENSSETNENTGRQLHFDIKQDAITFEGTERRNSLSENTNGGTTTAFTIEDAIMCEVKANIDDVNSVAKEPTPDPLPEPLAIKAEQQSENNFSLFSDSGPNSLNPKDSLTATPQVSELPEVPEIKQELTKADENKTIESEVALITFPAPSEELKDDTIKSVELTTSPASASSSSQTKKQSQSRDKDKRHHSQSSHSDDKQRRKSRERERERERDRESDKSRGKNSSSSKHSSHSSNSKHRSSSSKNDKSSTSTASSRSNHESSTSKRSSSRHDSSTHKKHKSSSSSSRSDRDKMKSRESHSQSHSHSHHNRSHNGSGSASSNSKRSDRERDRDRNKSSSNSTSNSINPSAAAIVQDDHNEAKAKLQKRHSNDSNDEGKPPGASGKSPTESAESQTKEKTTDSSAQNGKASETNGTNGTSGTNGTNESYAQSNNESTDEIVDAGNVINVSDILQQSTVSFIELSSASAAEKLAEDLIAKPDARETDSKPAQQAIESTSISTEPVAKLEIKTSTESESNAPNENVVNSEIPAENDCAKDVSKDSNTIENFVTESSIDADSQETIIAAEPAPNSENIAEPEPVGAIPVQPQKENGETFTHFEENAEEFNARLQLIEHNIKDRRMVLNVFSEIEDTSFPRRNSTKRRLSSEASSSKPHSSSSFSSCSSSPNAKAKRTRRDDAKTSPTPSEISVNSKENEELDKHEKGDLSSRRLSQKLCQQQRYTNDDLYKPRPLLSQRSRRRGLDSIL